MLPLFLDDKKAFDHAKKNETKVTIQQEVGGIQQLRCFMVPLWPEDMLDG